MLDVVNELVARAGARLVVGYLRDIERLALGGSDLEGERLAVGDVLRGIALDVGRQDLDGLGPALGKGDIVKDRMIGGGRAERERDRDKANGKQDRYGFFEHCHDMPLSVISCMQNNTNERKNQVNGIIFTK